MASRLTFDRDTRRRLRQRLNRTLRPAWLGTLRRVSPLSRTWGYDRGKPIDRYYIEQFLHAHQPDICGHALEVKQNLYVSRLGSSISRCDILDIDVRNPKATLITDITAVGVASDTYDCCVITQTLQLIWDVEAAVRELHRILRPGGVLLVTVPTISQLSADTPSPDYWRFTPDCCARLFGEAFGAERVTVQAYGNVLTSIAFLTGMAREELSESELRARDVDFPLVVGIRAVKDTPR